MVSTNIIISYIERLYMSIDIEQVTSINECLVITDMLGNSNIIFY